MRRRWGGVVAAGLLTMAAWSQTRSLPPAGPTAAAPAAAAVSSPTADVPEFGDLTVITSDRLVYDGRRQLIELDGSVVISDPDVKMKADRMRIEMAGSNQVKQIVATGRVVISQADKHAWADRATYDVAEGKFVLEGDPRILRGRDMMTGDRITFWRGQDRLECYPNARLILQPDASRKSDFLKGLR